MAQSNNSLLMVIALIGAAGLGGGAYYYLGKNSAPVKTQAAAEQPEAQIQQPVTPLTPSEAAIREEFFVLLNKFLAGLDAQMVEYREKRTTVRDIIQPSNMSEFAYVGENQAFAQDLMRKMNLQMDRFIASFDQTDQELRAYLRNANIQGSNSLLQQWKDTKDTELSRFMAFFSLEKDLLMQYQAIFEIYDASSGDYTIDPLEGRTVFAAEELQKAYDERMFNIARIQKEENAAFSEAPSKEALDRAAMERQALDKGAAKASAPPAIVPYKSSKEPRH